MHESQLEAEVVNLLTKPLPKSKSLVWGNVLSITSMCLIIAARARTLFCGKQSFILFTLTGDMHQFWQQTLGSATIHWLGLDLIEKRVTPCAPTHHHLTNRLLCQAGLRQSTKPLIITPATSTQTSISLNVGMYLSQYKLYKHLMLNEAARGCRHMRAKCGHYDRGTSEHPSRETGLKKHRQRTGECTCGHRRYRIHRQTNHLNP